ncbi:hypothetical protein [Microcoleus sp. bin38.metabat.b11b12b14.051]|uniref:hypothetical protein n=1 Tax=Microcoleus sp. bin38.metabat.b11b12b14.051 TaxID=2742709 RepID=UPI0025FDF04F|nr:hypothetical protein [Microcoleus sp. bin38.metabat.b11b12b14.051]
MHQSPYCKIENIQLRKIKTRILILLLLVVMPGFLASAVCAYYLIPEWATLTASYQDYRRVSESPSATEKEILIAKTAQEIHRINCFAEGVGLLLGGIIVSIGIQGICILPQKYIDSN